MQIVQRARFLFSAITAVWLGLVCDTRAECPYEFGTSSYVDGSLSAGGNFGTPFTSVSRRRISGSGSTGGGFSSASFGFDAAVEGDDRSGEVAIESSVHTSGDGSVSVSYSISIFIPVRTAFRVDPLSDLAASIYRENQVISAASGWLEPGTITIFGQTNQGNGARHWKLDLAVDPRMEFYSTTFNTEPIDDGWTVSVANVSAYNTYAPSDYFSVYQMTPAVVQPGGGPWAEVRLSRSLLSVDDFSCSFRNSWCAAQPCGINSHLFLQAMHRLELRLLDVHGAVIGLAGFNDSWIAEHGSLEVGVGSWRTLTGSGSATPFGNATFALNRAAGLVTVGSAGPPGISMTQSRLGAVRAVQMVFAHWPATHLPVQSTYGDLRAMEIALIGRRSCTEDINCDGLTDDSDFEYFVLQYDILDCRDPTMAIGCRSDFNSDDVVDDSDFLMFVAAYNRLLCP